MNRTSLLDAFRNISKRFVSWLSIVAIVLIGTSVILGLQFTGNSLAAVGNDFIDEHNYKDLNIACSMGVTQDEVEDFRSMEGVKDAEGVISFSGQLSHNGKNTGAMVISVTDRISVPYSIEGQIPTKVGECAINEELKDKLGVCVGDSISIVVSAARLDNVLTQKEYRITGIAGHPDYMEPGRVDFCILPVDSFDTKASAFDYTAVFVDVDAPENSTFKSKAYIKSVKDVNERIEGSLDPMTAKRKKTLSDDLDAEYAKAKEKADTELSKAKKQIDDAQAEFDEKIGEASKKIEDGEAEFNAGKEKAEAELRAGEKKIKDGEAEYNAKIADGERQLAEAEKQMEDELAYNKWKLFAGFLELDQAEKTLMEKERLYNEGLAKLLNGKDELDKGWAEYNNGVSQIDSKLPDSTINTIITDLNVISASGTLSPQDQDKLDNEVLPKLNNSLGRDPVSRGYGVLDAYDAATSGMDPSVVATFNAISGIDEFRSGLNKLSSGRARLEEGQRQYDEGKAELEDARKQLDQGWFSLEQGKKKLADGEIEFARKEPEARQKLANAKAEFEVQKADGAKQLEDAKNTLAAKRKEVNDMLAESEKKLQEGKDEFNREKEKGEKELSDARAKYDAAKKEAIDKLSDVRKQIDDAKNSSCEWFVQTRDANVYFVEFKSFCSVLGNVAKVFTPIYAGIVVIVCFFTMAIIVEEQSKQIGTCKALGMYKKEVRNKYLLFGVTAAVLGALIGIGGGHAFEKLISNSLNTTFVFDVTHKFQLLPLLIMPVGAALVTAFAVMWSSERVLSCSAVGLVSGNEPGKRGRSKGAKNNNGSVYVRLIMNNFLMDLGRETVSVVIILVCVLLIGLGTTIKLGHYNALKNQVENVFSYDICVTLSEKVTDEEKQKIIEAMDGLDYTELGKIGGVIQTGEGQTLTEIYCVEDLDRFKEFYRLVDGKGGITDISDEGVVTTFEMEEKNGLTDGREVTLITDSLKIAPVIIKGHYLLHVGKSMIMSSEYYKKVFGEEPKKNAFLIKVGDKDRGEVADLLSSMDGVSSINMSDDVLDQKAGMSRLYTAVVFVVIGFSIILSFMILLNLSNILVTHRMREILTMRVNGFSNGQVIGYLVREILVTTTLGIILGLLIGIPATSLIITCVESDGFMFLRKVYVIAWILAAGCEAVFSVIINSISFSRIKKIPLTDITKY